MATGSLLADSQRDIVNLLDEIVYAIAAGSDDPLAGTVEFVSRRVHDVLGYDPEDFIRDPRLWFQLMHPEDVDRLFADTTRIYASKAPGTRTYRMRHRLAIDYRWIEDRVVPCLDDRGHLIGIVGVARDVTAQRRVEEQFALVLRNVSDGFLVLDRDLRCLFINPAGARLVGLDPEVDVAGCAFMLEGCAFLKVLGAVQGQKWRDTCRAVVESRVPEHVSDHSESLGLWLEAEVFPVPQGVALVFRDVTSTKHTERLLRTWIDVAPVALIRSSSDGRLLDANGTAVLIFGYPSLDALLAAPAVALYGSSFDSADFVTQLESRARDGGVAFRLACYDGTRKMVNLNVRVILAQEGGDAEYLVCATDISDREELRASLASTISQYHRLFDENVTPMVVASLDGVVESANQAFWRLVGVPSGDRTAGGALASFYRDPLQCRRHFERLETRQRVEGAEQTLARADGSTLRVLTSSRFITSRSGERAVEMSFVDVEAKSRAEDALREALAERDLLLREVHHRVKNNLQVVSSLLAMPTQLQSHLSPAEFVQKSRDRVRAIALVHDMLHRSAHADQVSVSKYLDILVRSVEISYDAVQRRIDLEVRATDVSLTIDDAVRCGLIVNELVVNSLAHGFPEGRTGRVTVEADDVDDGHALAIAVTDDGVGLPLGFRPTAVTSLGVELVNNVAARNGGWARWTSQHGTRVDIRLVRSGRQDVPHD